MDTRKPLSSAGRSVLSHAVRATWYAGLPLAFAIPAHVSAEGVIDEVIVSGQRLSIETAQEIKRNSDRIVDSVAAVDIAALPDRTVTEALQRIPGVTIDRMFTPNDTNRFSAEGSGVLIRGLTQVRSELNGRDVFSARNTRALSFDDVPAELMAGVDVYKNPSADMIEGGIAGTVNLRTRMPFDSAGQIFGVSASANYGDFAEEAKPQASVIYSNRWETGIGEFGALVNVAYSELATRTDSIQYGRPFRRNAADVGATTASGAQTGCVDATTGASFDCVYIPQGVRWSELDFDRERLGYSVALQWRPTDKMELSFQGLRSDYTMDWVEHSAWFQDWAYNLVPAAGTAFEFDSNGIFRRGTITSTAPPGIATGTTTRAAQTNQVTSDYSLGFKYYPSDSVSIHADVQYSKATADNFDFTINSESRPPSIELDMTGSLPRVTVPAAFTADRSNYYWAAAMDDRQQNEGSEFATRADLEYTIGDGLFKSVKVGARFADREATNQDTGYNWAPITETWNGASALSYMNQVIPEDATYVNFDNFYRGNTSLPSGIWVANTDLVRNLVDNAARVQSAGQGGWVWAPDKFGPQDLNDQEEKTYAGFTQLRFGTEVGNLPLDGNIGLRYVKTKTTASGFMQQPNLTTYPLLDPNLVATAGTGQWVPVDQQSEYDDVLPSLNVRLKLTPDLQARFAASRAIARPSFDQVRATTNLFVKVLQTVDVNGAPIAQQVTEFTGEGGNPSLQPMQATQYDAALEWYFSRAGSVTGTVFYKDVENYFINGIGAQDVFGQTWLVKSTVNGDKGLIKGFEVGYSQFYDGLPGLLRGLGLQANFTYVDSQGSPGPTGGEFTVAGLPLQGLSKTSYNVIGMYQLGRFDARLAYNWRERWLLTTTDGDNKGTVWNDDFGQLDGSVFFRYSDTLQFGLEANNLTNSTQKLLVGPYKYSSGDPSYNAGYVDNRLYQNAWFTFDRRVAFTMRMTF
jgi:TonB-dependent receptor